MCDIMWPLTFSMGLFSPSRATSDPCVFVVANGSMLSFLRAELRSIVYTYHIFSVQSSIQGHFSSFHVLVMVNNAAMNVRIHTSLQINI